ncbi:MAG: SH3-like domain-containing protein, partial [Actinomycetota bacterium]
EELPPAEYLGSGYYARWLLAAENGAVDRGIVTAEALQRWRELFTHDPDARVPRADPPERRALADRFLGPSPQLAPASAPAFAVGDRVRVRRVRPEAHHRSPRYLRGVAGTVETVAGDDHLPGARRDRAVSAAVYTVAFTSTDIWGATDEPPFELMIDLWEPYLEGAS